MSRWTRLDVAMDQAALVRVLQPECGLADIVAGLFGGQRARLIDQPGQADADHILHCQEVRVADLIRIEREHDVGMRQLGRCLDFLEKAADRVRALEIFLVQHFQSDDSSEFLVPGLEDPAHAAFAQAMANAVGAQQQFPAVALEELVDLVRGEPVAVKELTSQSARIGELAGHAVRFFQARGIEKLILPQCLQKAGYRGYAH
jgi:hypothetical protein